MNESEPLELAGRNSVRFRGRTLLYFSGCDYFRLARHPRVLAAAKSALGKQGLNVAASRITTGNHPLYGALERALALFFKAPDALLVGSGYITNLIVGQALAGHFSHVLIDERAHPSLQDAANLFGCPIVGFKHENCEAVAQAITRCGRGSRLILLTDGMFAHDGSVAPLREYLSALPSDALLLVDDAHGAGVLGKTGQGTPEHCRVSRRRIIQTITLSKAFGAYGGAILGAASLRRQIVQRSQLFAGHTPVPLPLAAAAMESLRLLRTRKDLRRRLNQNALWLKSELRHLGFPDAAVSTPGPIISLLPKSVEESKRFERAFFAAGILPAITRYPGVPAQGCLRIVVSSEHSRSDLQRVVAACAAAAVGKKRGQ
jgi:7-keto-8-aminopelargonate synthetase-like enzyme